MQFLKSRLKLILLVVLAIPFLIGGLTAGYFLYKVWRVSNVISYEDQTPVIEEKKEEGSFQVLNFVSEKKLPQRGEDDRINILLLGKATPDYPGSNLTDTIILASINPQTFQSALLSIPRDLYVKIPETKRYTKINSIYSQGLKKGDHKEGMKLLEKTVKNITGEPIHYSIMVNFTAFSEAVDAIGGVDVEVEKDIYDDRYPAPGYAYQTFEIDAGRHHLDGETALKYVRVRHNAGGDFGRAKRQQQVLESMKDKFFAKRSWKESLDLFDEVLDIVEKNVKTDVPFADYLSFLLLAREVNIHQTVNKVLENSPEGLLEAYNPIMGRVRAYTLRPRAGSYYEIQRVANNIFSLDLIARQKKAIEAENSKVLIVASPQLGYFKTRAKNILREEGYTIVNDNLNCETVNLWQRPSKAQLPKVTWEEGKQVSSQDLIEKLEIGWSNLEKTTVYDNAEGSKPFSLEDITERLNAQVSLYKDLRTDADYVVILGHNIRTAIREEKEGEFFLTEEGIKQEEMERYEE